MGLPDYPRPLSGQTAKDSFGNGNDSRSSLGKSRHISMQSRVDSLVAETMPDHSRELSMPIPPQIRVIKGQGHSTSLLFENSIRKLNPEAMTDESSVQVPSTPPEETLPDLRIGKLHEVMFIGVVVMAQFMCLAGLGQAVAPVQYIAGGLGVTNPGEQAWFTAAYSLTTGTFILIAGRLGDILGHKRLFVFGYLFLGIWSGFAGFSAYVGRQIFFDICRAMQGIGSALLAPNALALLGRAYPPGVKKNLTFALFGAMAPWGFVVGAFFGALFSQTTWWPWTFWSFGAAAFGLSAFALLVVPKQLAKEAQFHGQLHRPGFDWAGSIAGVSGLVLINVAWNNGALFGWSKPYVYFIMIIGVLCLVAFIWVEAHAVSPLLPVSAFNGTVTYTIALVGIGWGSFGICTYPSLPSLHHTRSNLTNTGTRDLLQLALPRRNPRRDPPVGECAVHASAALRAPGSRNNRLHAHAHARLVCHADRHGRLLRGRSRRRLPARPPNLLGPDVRRHPHHAFRHGHVVPRRHHHPVEPHAASAPGPRGQPGQHHGQLQHLDCAGHCRYRRSTGQQRRRYI